MSKVVKKATKPFKKIGGAVKKTVSSVFKSVKGVAGKMIGKMAGVLGLTPKIPDMPEPKDPAPPAPEPEQYAEDMTRPENIGRRKRNRRNGLRIDLNTGGAPAGNGVNLPVG